MLKNWLRLRSIRVLVTKRLSAGRRFNNQVRTIAQDFNSYKNALFDTAVNDFGINRLRVALGATSSTSLTFDLAKLDYRMDNVVIPLRQRLMAKGKSLFINVNFGGLSAFPNQPDMSAYAQQVLLTYQHLQSKYGLIPNAWEVALEPGVVSPNWTPAKIDDAIIRSNNLLIANGFTNPYFIAPSSPGNPDNALSMFKDMLVANNGILPAGLKEFAYHRYGNPSPGTLNAIANLRDQFGITTSMLEHGGATYNELHADLKEGNVSAWQQYALAYCANSDNGYKYYIVDGNTISISSRAKFLRQYFKFIKPGAVRIAANSNNSGFDPLAFINPNGNYVVVVKASLGGAMLING